MTTALRVAGPHGLPAWFESLFVIVMGVRSVTRGIDYMAGDSAGTSVVLSYVEQSVPLHQWGTLFALAGAAMLVGQVRLHSDTHPRVERALLLCSIGGFTIGGASYTAISVGMGAAVVEAGFDGIRTPADTAGMAIYCAAYLVWCIIRLRMSEIRTGRIALVEERLRER